MPTIVPLKYGLSETKIIYSNHGNNKVNIYQEQRNEASAILRYSEETLYRQCSDYFQLVSRKKDAKIFLLLMRFTPLTQGICPRSFH